MCSSDLLISYSISSGLCFISFTYPLSDIFGYIIPVEQRPVHIMKYLTVSLGSCAKTIHQLTLVSAQLQARIFVSPDVGLLQSELTRGQLISNLSWSYSPAHMSMPVVMPALVSEVIARIS